NIHKIGELSRSGLMHPAGLRVYKNRKADTRTYTYENKPEQLPEAYEQRFRANALAWEFFAAQSVSYRKTIFYWILSAKRPETQVSRLEKVIDASGQKKRLQ